MVKFVIGSIFNCNSVQLKHFKFFLATHSMLLPYAVDWVIGLGS